MTASPTSSLAGLATAPARAAPDGTCLTCTAPVRVEWRYKIAAGGPETELVKVRCTFGHWYVGPTDRVMRQFH